MIPRICAGYGAYFLARWGIDRRYMDGCEVLIESIDADGEQMRVVVLELDCPTISIPSDYIERKQEFGLNPKTVQVSSIIWR